MSNKHNIIKFRRGTAAEWAASEPQPGGEVLRLGEPGWEKDTGKLKIGDGVTPWNNLGYVSGGVSISEEELQDLIGNGFLVGGSGINIDYNDNGNSITISTSGVSLQGHTHTAADITDFGSSVSGLLPDTYDAAVPWTINHTLVDGTRYLANDLVYENGRLYKANFDNESLPVDNTTYWTDVGPGYRLNIDGRDIPNIPYPVKDIIAGTNVSISSSSGVYTISADDPTATEANSLVTNVFNKTGNPIPKFSVVYVDGGQGDQPTIALAIASGEATSSKTYGITAETIDNMSAGKVIVFGALTGVNTDQFNPTAPTGDVNGVTLYLSPTTPGGVTTTKPSAPDHMVSVGTIVRTHQNEGVVEVRIQNGFELEELHNVAISGVIDGQFLQYDSDSELWIPSTSGNFSILLVNGSGVSLIGHSHTSSDITDFNSSVSGLLPSVTGTGYVNSIFDNNIYTISVSGLQPSGNYSLDGHTHSSSEITDFSSSVSGLLPIIANSGDNRILTSDGTSYGINAESNLLFNPTEEQTFQNGIARGPSLTIKQQRNESETGSSSFLKLKMYDSLPGASGLGSCGRIQFEKYRGTEISPSGVDNGESLGIIRFMAPCASGVDNVARIFAISQGVIESGNNFVPSAISINTSSGPNQFDNTLSLNADGKLFTDGYVVVQPPSSKLDTDPGSAKKYGVYIYIEPSGLLGSPSGDHILVGCNSVIIPRSAAENHNINYYGNNGNVFLGVPSGVTNDGAIFGANFSAWRNRLGSNIGFGWYDDDGSLDRLYGCNIAYGHGIGQSGDLGPAPTGVNPYTEDAQGLVIGPQRGYGVINNAYDLLILDDNYQLGTINNHYSIYQVSNHPNYLGGSLTVNNGLSAPTKIHSLGAVSGNVSVSYAIDKQIQTLTLNGTATNFIEGAGWPSSTSVDVLLEITVSSTTTVTWTLVDDWYNPPPTFNTGKYLVLLRSIGTTIQGHYIGNKTN
jgi:hypothetical protein